MKMSLRTLRTPGTLLSTLAFVAAGAAATVAVATSCYVSNGTGWCCVPMFTECYDNLGDEWMCISDSPDGDILVNRVAAAPSGVAGKTYFHMTSSTCLFTFRTCGPQINSCLPESIVTMTCTSNVPNGLPCSGIEW